MDFEAQLGIHPETGETTFNRAAMADYVNLKLTAMGLPVPGTTDESTAFGMSRSLLASYREKSRLLENYLPPCDQRIQDFLNGYFAELGLDEIPQLPTQTLVLDRHGVSRLLALPAKGDRYTSPIMDSYRIAQGVLHNPTKDRRTTAGVFHVAEGGLPVPNDKKAVPKLAVARLLKKALAMPEHLCELPYLSELEGGPHGSIVSLLMRPVVVPAVPGFTPEKSYEVRFFAPGTMVSNLDFVESIFGNGGDPFLPENDAALDPEHWSGQTGCVIQAPHLMGTTKKELGLPHISEATERQKRDRMCWEDENELYNDGGAFKITLRTAEGVVVTAIADSYFGYSKKEVKTQISFAANLHGLAEEEHAGGALVFPGYDLGEDFQLSQYYTELQHSFTTMQQRYGDLIDFKPEGYGVDKRYPEIHYLPEDARIELNNQTVSWSQGGMTQTHKLLPTQVYVYPNGYKVRMLKPAEGRRWRLVGHLADSLVCHKPCTVSGGGKSEISKPITDAIISGPVFVQDFEKDFDLAEEIINYDYSRRYRNPALNRAESRALLSPERSIGSVIQLLTPSETEYTDPYNQWLAKIPQHVKELVLIIKRFYKPDWGSDWRNRFSVDLINGQPGNILRYRNSPMITQYLRVGYTQKGEWRTFGLRKDFIPAAKISMEDDITASVVAPANKIQSLPPHWRQPSAKFVQNCEYRFFQRPDDAVIRGYDKQAEADLASDNAFLSNYEPLEREHAKAEIDDAIRFGQYTQPMQEMVRKFAAGDSPDYYCTSAYPRLVGGTPTKNPRYQQTRPDLKTPREVYLANMSTRLYRQQDAHSPLTRPVTSVLPGRRNNPADPAGGVKPLCVNNPIHYMELPELFMEFIASITGKSPSTTGAGSEGALTKAPFNALPPIYDLNNALVAYLATAQPTFITAAGYVGPYYRVDHDISLLVPEIWCRLKPEETDADYLIGEGYLERVEDFEYKGQQVPASRIGYRINARFVRHFFGRVFTNPTAVFSEEMLKPELQSMDIFVEGMLTIAAAHKEVAMNYFADGSVEDACPPLKALLHIMAHGEYGGKGLNDPAIRGLFTREAMLESDWYRARLDSQQTADKAHWSRMVAYLEKFLQKRSHADVAAQLNVPSRFENAKVELARVSEPGYTNDLVGTIGRQPIT
ncbi:MAG: hypothetical protein ACFB21_11340 [Opitutales bacterium]